MANKFAWIEINYNADIDISDFLSNDGTTVDKDAMQKSIKEELLKSHPNVKTIKYSGIKCPSNKHI